MKILKYSFVVLLLSSSVAVAKPASEHTIRQILTVTQARRLADSMRGKMGNFMFGSIRQALKGKHPNARQQQAITHMKSQMVALMNKTLAWPKLEPIYIKSYEETFSEKEAKDMLAFYKTPAGQAVIHKMPMLMNKIMLNTRQVAISMVPQMQKIQQQFFAEMQAASKSGKSDK